MRVVRGRIFEAVCGGTLSPLISLSLGAFKGVRERRTEGDVAASAATSPCSSVLGKGERTPPQIPRGASE